MMTRVRAFLAILVAACTCLQGTALASPAIKLNAKFQPYRLGSSTTMTIGFRIKTPRDELPPSLTEVDLHLPSGLIIASSTLGLVTCNPAVLMRRGVSGCSPNSIMGRGSALVGIPI